MVVSSSNTSLFILLTTFSIILLLGVSSAEPLNITFVDPTPSFQVVSNNSLILNASLVNQTALSSSINSYGGFNINNSLLAWWTMDEESGNAMLDKSGRGNTLSMFGNASRNTTFSKFGCCSLYLNNSPSDYTRNTGRGILNDMLTNNGFTISFWINFRHRDAPDESFILISNGANANGIRLTISNATSNNLGTVISLTLGNGTANLRSQSKGVNLTAGNWYHIAVVYYREIAYYYYNGELHSVHPYDAGINVTNSSNNFINVGNHQTGSVSPAAFLDDFLIYSRPLMSDEIRLLYNVSGADQQPRYFSSRFFNWPADNISLNAFGMASSGAYNLSSNITINLTQSAPYFLAANASFEPAKNRTTLSAWISPGFYNGSTSYPVSAINGSAYYRINDGNWVYINQSHYLAKNSSLYFFFGDSFTGYGSSSVTWDYVLGGLSKVAMWNTPQKFGIPSTTVNQMQTNMVANATNNSKIFFQGGTNDITAGASDNTIKSRYVSFFNAARTKNLSIYLANIIPRNISSQNVNVSNLNTFLYDYYLNNNSDNLIVGFTDLYSVFLDNSSNLINNSLSDDGLHPNYRTGIDVWGQEVFRKGFHYRYHDGFYAEFIPTVPEINSTYDLKWIVTTPTGESSEYQWDDFFTLAGTYPPVNETVELPSTGGRSGFGPGITPRQRNDSNTSQEGSEDPLVQQSPQEPPLKETSFISTLSNYLAAISVKAKELATPSVLYIGITAILALAVSVGLIKVLRSRAHHHSSHSSQSWWLWKK